MKRRVSVPKPLVVYIYIYIYIYVYIYIHIINIYKTFWVRKMMHRCAWYYGNTIGFCFMDPTN